MVKRKSKSKKGGKTYKLELTFLSSFIWGVFLFFLLTWVFVLGILVGRGFLPEAVTTLSGVKNQITKLQDMVDNKGTLEKNSKNIPESDPELVFYDRLSSKKDEVKKNWPLSRGDSNTGNNPPKSNKTGSRYAKQEKKQPYRSGNTTRPVPLNDSIHFTVQIASLADGNQAEKMIKQLNKQGYPAYFYEVSINGKAFYRVRCGKFADREEAKKYAEKLDREEGIKAFVSKLE